MPDSDRNHVAATRLTCRRRCVLACVAVAVLVLFSIPPREPLIVVDHDGAGWSVVLRPLKTMLHRGFLDKAATFDVVKFDAAGGNRSEGYCATRVGQSVGPLVFWRLHDWAVPVNTAGVAVDRRAACEAQRKRLIGTPDSLAAALVGGQPDLVKRSLYRTLGSGQALAVLLPEVGQPMRDKLARLMLADPRMSFTLSELDVALAVGDGEVAQAELEHMREDSLTDYQRHAFYRMGLAGAIARHAEVRGDRLPGQRLPALGGQEPGSGADGFRRSDFDVANAYCDAGYAGFLIEKGIAPTDETVVAAFLARMVQEAPRAASQLNLDYPYRDLERGARMRVSPGASTQACAALAARYRDVVLSAQAVDALATMTGVEMLARYQDYARRQMKGQTFRTNAEEDAFYDRLVFNQDTVPMPALPLMFTTLLEGRPSGPAACAALSALPRMLDHDAAMDAFKSLAASWRGVPIQDAAVLSSCQPGLVFPPSYIPQETRDQNSFLRQAGIACTVSTPRGKYVYNQEVSCGRTR